VTTVEPMLCRVTTDPLSSDDHLAAVAQSGSGATVLFAGVVRDHDHGRAVVSLEYVAHPTAADVLRDCLNEISTDPDVRSVAASHRVGELHLGDAAVVAAVSAAHRAEAFAACARLVDLLKQRLPVWKRQIFADGTDEWVNCP
jgi:molybdopterin synthase catalytic subunit